MEGLTKIMVTLIKTDYEEGRLQPTQAGHLQLATPLFISPHDILKRTPSILISNESLRLDG
jgi:hypothetical protein